MCEVKSRMTSDQLAAHEERGRQTAHRLFAAGFSSDEIRAGAKSMEAVRLGYSQLTLPAAQWDVALCRKIARSEGSDRPKAWWSFVAGVETEIENRSSPDAIGR